MSEKEIEQDEIVEEQLDESLYDSDAVKLAKMITDFGQTAKDMSKEDFLAFLNKCRLYQSFIHLRNNIADIEVEGNTDEENFEEKLFNVLGHLGYIVTQSKIDGKWECASTKLRDALVVVRDRSKLVAMVRTAIIDKSGIFYFPEVEDVLIAKWMHENKAPHPYVVTDMEAKVIGARLGLDIEQMEIELKAQEQNQS